MDDISRMTAVLPQIPEALTTVLTDSTTETIIVTDGDCRSADGPTILFANKAAMIRSGYAVSEMIGRKLRLLYSDDVFPAVLAGLVKACDDRNPVVTELQTTTRDGQLRWLEIITTPVMDAAGIVQNFVRVGRDVSARKHAEASRETTQRLLASVFGVINEPLAVADPKGNLTMANTAVTRKLGWSIFDLMGKPVTNVLAEADRPAIDEMMSAGSALDQTRQIKCLLRIKGKPDRPGEVDLTSILQQDGQQYHVLTLRPQKDDAATDADWNFELAVREAMKGGGPGSNVVAGKLQLVGLEDVKESLGDKWPAIAQRAFAIAERAIKKSLRPGDVFRKTTEDGYLVLFAHLSENEAQFKARAIADEIREKLTGEIPDLAEAKVASITGTVPIEGAQQSEESIIARIERQLREERERTEIEAKAALSNGLKKGHAVFSHAMTATGSPAPVVFVNLSPEMKDADEALKALGINHLALEAENFLLAGAAQRVLGGLSKSVGELIVTPVRLQTLAQHRASEAWLEVARTLGEAAKRQIVVELREIPKDVASSRIADTIQRLSSLFKSIAIELPETDLAFVDKLPSQIRLMTIEYARIPWAGDAELTSNFARTLKVLDAKQRRLVVRHVSSVRRRNILAKHGITLFAS
ncbi:MAG: PAS domain S-box protein [Proteobacteria bacterium]|nr:PAS domain S-box protein [Pseudomonadota bacterium]